MRASDDGKLLATGSFYGTVVLWDISKRQSIRCFDSVHDGAILSMAFDTKRMVVYSGGFDRKINRSRAIDKGPLPALELHKHPVAFMDISADNNILVSAGLPVESEKHESEFVVWNCETGERIRDSHLKIRPSALIHSTGKRYLVGDVLGKIYALDTDTLRIDPITEEKDGSVRSNQ
jgi:WD40 repeat protein